MDEKKVLVICQGYYKSKVIQRLIPWKELGYHLIVGLNSYYSISAIRKINPDALIVVDYMPGQTIGAVLEMYRHVSSPMRIILVPYEQNLVSEEDRKAFRVIAWNDLTAKTLMETLEQVFRNQPLYDRGIFPEHSDEDPFRGVLDRVSRMAPPFPMLLLRAVFRKSPDGAARGKAEQSMQHAVDAIGSGNVVQETERKYCLFIEIPTSLLGEGFWRLNGILEELQNRLSHIAETDVVLFLSEIIGNTNLPEEYEKVASLEPYAFFHSHHSIQSVTFIQRHTFGQEAPVQEVNALYLPLLRALIRNQERAVREILEDIYLRHVKLYQNTAFYRLVRSQLQAIYSCACCINEYMELGAPPANDFWSIEEALDAQIGRFTAHFPVPAQEEREWSKLTSGTLEIILQKYSTSLYASAIADMLGVSEAHLSRVFKKDVGIGITECVRYVRVYTTALELLEEQRTIKEVAKKHGFEDPKYFNKVFRKVMGTSPTEWLRAQRVLKEEP
ncbi:MAG: AraC family transcriptional regulator [Clostridia bacterium]|nr:AraC family transcriptional regulator [Clostridia bacterium]